MKLSAILSLASLGATATLAFPLFHFGDADVERRDAAYPVARRTAEATATAESSAAAESTPTPTATSTASEESATETATYLYSTITEDSSLSRAQETTRTRTRQTETAPAAFETQFPEGRSNLDLSNAVIIHQREVVTVTEFIVVEKPVLVSVQLNLNVRQQLFASRFQDNFRNRFNRWDQAVIDHLSLLIAQQFDQLSRIGHGGFGQLDLVNFESFVGQIVQQFQVFQSFQLDDVRLFAQLLQNLNVGQLASFFGRSDALFSQDLFNQFGINNDFGIFVSQLLNLLNAIQGSQFNANDLFGLINNGQLLNNLLVVP